MSATRSRSNPGGMDVLKVLGGDVRPIRERKPADLQDVREVVVSALDGFCAHFGLSGAKNRRAILRLMSKQARLLAEEVSE